jgi:hypothetical protein
MALGDTQEVVTAVIAALGTSNLNSVTELKTYSPIVQQDYNNLLQGLTNPVISVSPSFLNLGSVALGVSKQDSVTVRNVGNSTLTISVAASSNPHFTVMPLSGNILPSGSQRFYITFTPVATGVETSDVVFTHNAAGSPDTVSVTAEGLDALEWLGTQDSVWFNPNNWQRNGVVGAIPTPTDFVLIPGSVPHNPFVGDDTSGPLEIGALRIYLGGILTFIPSGNFSILGSVTIDTASAFLIQTDSTLAVGGDIILNGTLEVAGSVLPTITVNGTWIEGPNSLFIPGGSTVPFTGTGTVGGNFSNVVFDTGSSMTSNSSIVVSNQCEVRTRMNLRSVDTLFILSEDSSALFGAGIVDSGTIERSVQENLPARYRFESDKTYIKFLGSATYPSMVSVVSVTTYPDTTPSSFGTLGVQVPSTINILENTVRADSTYPDGRWVIVRPEGSTEEPLGAVFDSLAVRRVYEITSSGDTNLRTHLSLRYEQSEVPSGVPEESLRLFRLDSIIVSVQPSGVTLPYDFALYQNYPNPFNPATVIRYELPVESNIAIRIHNILGQEVKTLVNEEQAAGVRQVIWNGRNNAGASVASGVYFYRLQAGDFVDTKKLLLLK